MIQSVILDRKDELLTEHNKMSDPAGHAYTGSRFDDICYGLRILITK